MGFAPRWHRAQFDAVLNDPELFGGTEVCVLCKLGRLRISSPRRAMGHLLGHGVRFGVADSVMAAGEGIETLLSVRQILPAMPMIAALSSPHLGAILFPAALRRLYVVRDDDPAGDVAVTTLSERASSAGIEVVPLSPMLGDHNKDLRLVGPERMRAALRPQLVPADVGRFLMPSR